MIETHSVQKYRFEDTHDVRSALVDGEPYFAMIDLAIAAGFQKPRDVIREIIADYGEFDGPKGVQKNGPPLGIVEIRMQTAGGTQKGLSV